MADSGKPATRGKRRAAFVNWTAQASPVSGMASQDPRIAHIAEAPATVEARAMAVAGATEAPISSSPAALSPEARRQRLSGKPLF